MAESLAIVQRRWADHVRDPSMPAPDGVEARRMAVYRRLCIDSPTPFWQAACRDCWNSWAKRAGAVWSSTTTHITSAIPRCSRRSPASSLRGWLCSMRSRCPAGRRNWRTTKACSRRCTSRHVMPGIHCSPCRRAAMCWRCRRWCGYWATGGRCMRTPRYIVIFLLYKLEFMGFDEFYPYRRLLHIIN